MKKQSLYAAGASFVYMVFALVILGLPVRAAALPDTPVVIAEVQPGTTDSASQEFVELMNVSDRPVDFDAGRWQLVIASASAKDWTPYRTVVLHGVLEAGATYSIGSTYTAGGVAHTTPYSDVSFAAGLSATGGHLQLSYAPYASLADGSCALRTIIADTVEWTTVTNGIYSSPSVSGRTPFVTPSKSGVVAPNTLQRAFDTVSSTYMDTDNDAADFVILPATPRLPSIPVTPGHWPFALLPLRPIADACDPNQPAPSSDTGPTEPSDEPPAPTDGESGGSGTGDGGDDGTATTPTDAASSNTGLMAPQITELFPNPAAPQTDGDDEYIELYNPNEAPYDVSGLVLSGGGATERRYVIPANTVLAPYAYLSFQSSITGISLPNTGGSAGLWDEETPLATLVAYSTAPEGQAWAYADGTWQWTTAPTPGAANTITKPVVPPKKTTTAAAKPAAKKTTAVKAAATTKKPKATAAPKAKAKKAATAKTQLTPVAATVRNPIHIGVLAAIGVFALLYGAYEYRHDMANKIHQFRANRAARRAARQSAARR